MKTALRVDYLERRDNGAWDQSLDGGATWTPTHEGPSDA